jgi:hypothetical protein
MPHKRYPWLSQFIMTMIITSFTTHVAAETSWMDDDSTGVTQTEVWQSGIITAKGEGIGDPRKTRLKAKARIFAMKAASLDAKRNLLSIIQGVKISSGTVVKDLELESDQIAARVKGMLRGAFVIKRNVEYMEDAYVAEVIVGLCLNASVTKCQGRPNLASALIRNVKRPAPNDLYQPQASQMSQSSPMNQTTPEMRRPVVIYTSVIVETAGLGIEPAMVARVLTESGKEVYGLGQVNPGVTESNGMVRYVGNLAQAKKLSITGNNPMIIKGVKLGGDGASDVVVSKADAVKIFEAATHSVNILKDGKVIFVVN